MRSDDVAASQIYLDLTEQERLNIARGDCKNPYVDAKVPLRSHNGQIQRHVPLRQEQYRSLVLDELVLPIAFRLVDAVVHEAAGFVAVWWEQRKSRTLRTATRGVEAEGSGQGGRMVAPDLSEASDSGDHNAEIIDLESARESRAAAG